MLRLLRVFPIVVGAVGACAVLSAPVGADSGNDGGRGARLVPAAAALTPLQAVQLRSVCARCHARPGSGAPLIGDTAAWTARAPVGFEVLLARTIDGYRTMPPLGTCGSCDEADFRALVVAVSGVADPGRPEAGR